MADAIVTLQVEEELMQAFASVAKARGQTEAELLKELMRETIAQQGTPEYDAWFRRQVQIGLESARSGRTLPASDVEAYFAALREETRRVLHAARQSASK